jgi:hypothetical protein
VQSVPDVLTRACARLSPDTRAVLVFLYRRGFSRGRPAHRPATVAEIAYRTRLPRGAVVPALGELFGLGLVQLAPARGWVAAPDLLARVSARHASEALP